MKNEKMLEYAYDLRSDLKYAFDQGEGQIPNHKDVMVMDWLIEQVNRHERTIVELEESIHIARSSRRDLLAYITQLKEKAERYEKALKTIVKMETVEEMFGRPICTGTGIIAQKTLEG